MLHYIEVDINRDSYVVVAQSEAKAKEIIADQLNVKYDADDMYVSVTDGEDKTIDEILEYWGANIRELPNNSVFVNGYLYSESGKIIH